MALLKKYLSVEDTANMSNSKKILITGVAGFLGSQFAKWVHTNHPEIEIHGIDNFSCGYPENIPDYVNFTELSLGNHSSLPYDHTFEYVFHFAAYAAEGRSPFIRCYNYRDNVLATAQIVNHCINNGTKRLVYTSSMAVYGQGSPPFDELNECYPIDPYGVAKYACEMDIQIAGTQHDLDWCIIRPHNVFGVGQCIWNDYRNVLGIWMRQALMDMPLRIYGNGKQERAFSYIDDMLPCLWRAAVYPQASKQIINLGGSKNVSINQAANVLRNVIGDPTLPVEYTEPRHEVFYAWSTTQKSEELLDYQEHIGLYQGLRTMWDWAKTVWDKYPQRQTLKDPLQGRSEITKGLYSYWQ